MIKKCLFDHTRRDSHGLYTRLTDATNFLNAHVHEKGSIGNFGPETLKTPTERIVKTFKKPGIFFRDISGSTNRNGTYLSRSTNRTALTYLNLLIIRYLGV